MSKFFIHIHGAFIKGKFATEAFDNHMSKRTKKATKKIERLRNRLIHVDWVPDMKVGWLTRYMFVGIYDSFHCDLTRSQLIISI